MGEQREDRPRVQSVRAQGEERERSMGEQGRGGGQGPLGGVRGHTSIEDGVVAKIAGIAAQEVEKVQMGGGATAAVSGFLGSVAGAVTGGTSGGGAGLTTGVSVEVGEEEAVIDLTLAVEYGVQIPRTTEEVRRSVMNRVENLTGLRVPQVNITVNDVQFPEERPQLGRQQELEQTAQQHERQT